MRQFGSIIPGWTRIILAIGAIGIGVWLLGNPFDAIELFVASLGVGAIAGGLGSILANRDRSMTVTVIAIAAVLLGLACLWFQDVAIRSLPVVVAGVPLAMGLRRLWSVIRRQASNQFALLASGIAWAGFGVLALIWRDLTLVLIGLLIGPLAIAAGTHTLISAIRKRTHRAAPGASGAGVSPRRAASLRLVGSTLCAVVAVAMLVGTVYLDQSAPRVEAFYETPDTLPDAPGQLLTVEPFSRGMPDRSRAYRILYSTLNLAGDEMSVGSALVIVPESAPVSPVPVILWAHGTSGIAQNCAPSLADVPLGTEAMPGEQQVIDNGWAIVAPDYIGLGTEAPHPYLVGAPTARSSLDALRAAHQISDLKLSAQSVVWGHSQGGGAALWIGIESQTYAPDLGILGIAALSPATDLPNLAGHLVSTTFGRVFGAFMLEGFAATYDDVRISDYIRPAARLPYEAMADRCLQDERSLASLFVSLVDDDVFIQEPTSGPLASRLAENVPAARTGISTFIGQGDADEVIDVDVQRAFVELSCTNGQIIEYYEVVDGTHLSVVENDSPMVPALIDWTTARFSGDVAAIDCTKVILEGTEK